MTLRACIVGLAFLQAGWIGSDSGHLDWSRGVDKEARVERSVPYDAVARVEPGHLQVVFTLALPDRRGDAVLGLRVARGVVGEPVDLPDPRVEVRYTEYDAQGHVVFRAGEVRGRLHRPRGGGADLAFALGLSDAVDPRQFRRVDALDIWVDPVETESDDAIYEDDPTVVVVPAAGGCDEGWSDDYEDDDEYSSAGYDSGSSGCEGDDFDDGGYDDSGSSGCEGDDLSSADSGGGCDGCDGDAIAAGACPRRSPWPLRVLNWLPWFCVFLAIRLLKSRPRRRLL